MISAISGLPELLIDKQNDVKIDIELDEKQAVEIGRASFTRNKETKNESSLTSKAEIKEKKFNQDSVDELNKELKSILDGNQLNVEFKFEKEANQLIMKLIDVETDEVVRQVPPDIMLKIARIVSSQLGSGALADAKV
ncbi:MAG: flagellar protein FlaG [Candidatus Kapabacteria bacterium]|jgi:flagellar protein FlaG|nr:flagellar protein FlaG [Candidatus Kapabacteria bacterium]